MELLEREQQLATLRSLLSDASHGSGRLVFVTGDAGSGKTQLVRRFCDSTPTTTDVMWGMCDALSTPRTLGPLLDIAPHLDAGIVDLVRNGRRDVAFDAVRSALTSRDGTSVIVFEDLHWADEATLDLLRYLGRRLRDVRLLLIATYRNDEAGPDHPLRVVLGDLASVDAMARLTVPPLTLDAVTVLARGRDVDPHRLYAETGGNAFFVTEVLAGGIDGLPPAVSDLVQTRVSRLPSAARRMLEAAAIAGPRFEASLMQQMDDFEPTTLDECVSSGLLQVTPAAYEFRHELARQAVLGAITPARRAALHAEVLAILRREPDQRAHLDRLAHHAESAGDVEAILEFAPAAAAVAASLKSHRGAAAHYSKALQFAGSLPPRDRAELLLQASYERHLIDDLDEAGSLAEQALAIWRELGERRKVGDTLRWLSRVNWLRGRTPDAELAADEAIAVLDSLPPCKELAMAYSNKAQLSMVAHRVAETELWGVKALTLARELDEQQIVAHALNNLGTIRLHSGDRRGAKALLESLRISVELGLEDDAARAWTNLSAAFAWLHELESARRHAEDGLRYCIDHDLDANRVCIAANLADTHFRAGHWDDAVSLCTELMRDGRLSRVTRVQLFAITALVAVRRCEGDPWPALDEAASIASRAGDLQFVGLVAAARAEACWFSGRAADIAAEVAPARAAALEADDRAFIGQLSYWMWKAGSLTTAIDHAGGPYALQISGDARAAHKAWIERGYPYEAALALAESDDEPDLRAAIAALASLGAKAAVAEVTQRLRARGANAIPRGPRVPTRRNPAGLTAREMDILGLLSDGLRNPEIARRLFLSPKTVDHHVSAILAKLDVRSRSDAVARARELVPAGNRT
jgi:DNA-binding CsgD family transcriptional regulator